MSRVTVADIKSVVVEHFGLNPIEMVSDRRQKRVARPRQLAMTLARDLTPYSFPHIAREFGKRDHTTVMHAVAVTEQRCNADSEFRKIYEMLRERIEMQAAA